MKRILSLGFATVVLMLAVMILVRASVGQSGKARFGHLVDRLPLPEPPWVSQDLDIASTEEMKRAVDELLNYDRAVFREYKNGAKGFSVYVAHWQPRKFHPRLISIHTPDVCWVANGWSMGHADFNYSMDLTGSPAWPAQYREFTAGGKKVYVLYWHIMNGELSGYASGPSSSSRSFWGRLLMDVKDGTGEQFFIRISSEQPWEVWRHDPFFVSVLSTFYPVLAAVKS